MNFTTFLQRFSGFEVDKALQGDGKSVKRLKNKLWLTTTLALGSLIGVQGEAQASCSFAPGPVMTCIGDGNPATSETGISLTGNNATLHVSSSPANPYDANGAAGYVVADATQVHWYMIQIQGAGTTLNVDDYTQIIPSSFAFPRPINWGTPLFLSSQNGSGTANISAEAIINNFNGPAIDLRGHDVTLNLNNSTNPQQIYSIAGETISFIPFSGVATAGIFSNNPTNTVNAGINLDSSAPYTIGNYRIGPGQLTLNNNTNLGGNIDLVLKVYEPDTPVAPGGFGIPADPNPFRIGTTIFNNNNTVTGYFQLGSGNDVFTNASGTLFDLRNFADTNRDLVRDTESVAIADFGSGNDTFANASGSTLRLAPVAAPATVVTAGQYRPSYVTSSVHDISNAGVEQGWFTGLESFNNAGVITMQDGVVGDLIGITGSTTPGTAGNGVYTSNGGILALDTVLNKGGPAASMSDVLVVDSTLVSGGPTSILINNVGGSGARTVGNGILVVEVLNDANSANNAFALANGPLIAGAFQYDLYYGGVGADVANGDWYLRNNYLPSVPAEEAAPQILLGLNGLPSLQQRVGNRSWTGPRETVFCKNASQNYKCPVTGDQASTYADGKGNLEGSGLWVRIEGAHTSVDDQAASDGSTGAGYDANSWKLQAGLDGQLMETDSGKLIAGLTGHYGTSDASINSSAGDGSIDTTGYGLGATLTWYGNNGFYVDGQGQYSWYDSDLKSDTTGSITKGNDGTGYALSLEAGQRLELGHDLNLTPQAQLVYSAVDFDSFTGSTGEDVSLSDGDSLKGRLGLALGHDSLWSDDASDMRRSHVYAIANLYHEFLDGTTVNVSGTKLTSTPAEWTGELGLGGSYNWHNDAYSLYGEVSAASDLENLGDSYDLKGTIGFRIAW